MPNSGWSSVVTYSDPISAEAALPILKDGRVPCRITSDATIPGLASFFSVEVPSELLHRARVLLDSAKVSDAELTYLATQELPGDSDGK